MSKSDKCVSDLTNEELISRVMKNLSSHARFKQPRWHIVACVFALGSTYATQLCKLHNLDPDEKV